MTTDYGSVLVRLRVSRVTFLRRMAHRVAGLMLAVAGLVGLAELSTVPADAATYMGASESIRQSAVSVSSGDGVCGVTVCAVWDVTRPCLTDEAESAFRCVWDARHMGNGVGRSFVIRSTGDLVYIGHRRAHRLMVTFR